MLGLRAVSGPGPGVDASNGPKYENGQGIYANLELLHMGYIHEP